MVCCRVIIEALWEEKGLIYVLMTICTRNNEFDDSCLYTRIID